MRRFLKGIFNGILFSALLANGLQTLAGSTNGCRLTRTMHEDGGERIILENRYVKLTFSPSQGGRCVSFVYKPTSTEWTEMSGDTGGLLGDRIISQRLKKDWLNAGYQVKIRQNTPEKLSMELAAQGASGSARYITFRKTVILTKRSPEVVVKYAFEVDKSLTLPVTEALWFHNILGVPGRKVNYFFPTGKGIRKAGYNPVLPSLEFWEYDPAQGWMAAIAENGSGLACLMEYQRLMCFYQWYGKKFATQEWAFRNFTVKDGESLSTEVRFLPFQGLKNVSGAGNGGVMELNVPPTASQGGKFVFRGKIFAETDDAKAKFTGSVRKLPERIWRQFGEKEIKLQTGKLATFELPVSLKDNGLYEIRVRTLDRTGKVLVESRKPFRIGKTSQSYTLEPEAPRLGNPGDRIGNVSQPAKLTDVEVPWRLDVVTPHVKWAKPYAKGKVKVLFLLHFVNAREIVELAQRMDIDFDAPLIDYDYRTEVGDYFRKQNPMIINRIIKNLLTKNHYDVIVISGLHWYKDMFKGIPELIKKQLDKGTGLVAVVPYKMPKSLAELLPFRKVRPNRTFIRKYAWNKSGRHPISNGVPVTALPPTGVRATEPEGGETFLTAANGQPIGICWNKNGQRTVAFTYFSSFNSGHADGLTPYLYYPKKLFPYWEYYLSLMAKAVLWAAHKEPDVELSCAVKPVNLQYGGKVNVELGIGSTGLKKLPEAKLEVTVRNKYWKKLLRKNVTVNPAKGADRVKFHLDGPLPLGTYFIDCRLKCQNQTVAWGSFAFEVNGKTRISKLDFAPGSGRPENPEEVVPEFHGFKHGDKVELDAAIAGAEPGMLLRATLRDNFGRLVSEKTYPVPADKNSQVKIDFPVEHPIGSEGRIRVALLSKSGRIIDTADTDFVMFPDARVAGGWDGYELNVWGGVSPYIAGYLNPLRSALIKDIGFSAAYNSCQKGWIGDSNFRNFHEMTARLGFNAYGLSPVDHEVYMITAKSAKDLKNYLKTKDKKYLCRKPSLSDPKIIQESKERVRKVGRRIRHLYPKGMVWTDEFTIIGRLQALDYDFSPPALKAFRKWLRKFYPELADLNREWGSSFTSWDQVVPDTAEEAAKKGNYASWSDHRTFMEDTASNFFSTLGKELHAVAPRIGYGLCGTQKSTAYNGWNWEDLFLDQTFFHPYYYGGQPEFQYSFKNLTPVTACVNPGIQDYGERMRLTWKHFLNGSMGVTMCAIRSMFNPDYTQARLSRAIKDSTVFQRESGIDKVWLKTEPDFDRVAVLYSQRSIHGHHILGKDWELAHNGWYNVLYDLGYSPRLLTSKELDAGKLSPERFKVLVLPQIVAISAKQAKIIADFVRKGGVVICGSRPGIMDGHCKFSVPGMLDKLFGIRHEKFNVSGPAGNVTFPRKADGLNLAGLSLKTSLVEGALRAEHGHPLGNAGGVPCAIVNTFGKGKTCYLNLDLTKYFPGKRNTAGGKFIRGIAERVLDWAGVKTAYKVKSPGNDVFFRICRLKDGNNLYVGYLRPKGNKRTDWQIDIGPKKEVYDCLAGKYLGRINKIPAISANRFRALYALLPYKVKALTVTPAKSAAKPGERIPVEIKIVTDKGSPGNHGTHVTVLDPAGKEAEHYSGNFLLKNGKGVFELPFALNDSPGKWKLKVKDAATGMTGEASVNLQASGK